MKALSISNFQLYTQIVSSINEMLIKTPVNVLPILHRTYREQNLIIPSQFHISKIFPVIQSTLLFKLKSLEVGDLIELWLNEKNKIAFTVLEIYGKDILPCIDLYLKVKNESFQFVELEKLRAKLIQKKE